MSGQEPISQEPGNHTATNWGRSRQSARSVRRLAIHIAGALAMVLMVTVVGFAHHGLAAFDQTKKVTLKGTVTAFRFMNPHSIVEFEVKDDKGASQVWQAELTSAVRLKGWTPRSIEPGNSVTVLGYVARAGAPHIWVLHLSSSNGVEVGATPVD